VKIDSAPSPIPGNPEDHTLTTQSGTTSPGNTAAVTGRSIPAIIGRYRILRLLGEGGMGTVYEAEQQQPHRTVALKVIKPGLASALMLRRFENESQALARLQHPGIAQIYEAGTADAGFGPQPYFAMEFIRGESLLRYAESHHLDVRQRLELMVKVCEAVHHAHQRGIIHRDLKPGNILVDETGQPKVLDFGLARMTDSDAQATRQTDMGQLLGTLAYMSPEQVLADPLELDTRSDVYALGVILYELLARRLPYTLSRKLHEAVQTIREEDPAPLSSYDRGYRGDIEIIVSKALEKEPARRYSSAAALAGDVRRYLQDEPITARPPTASYQLKKFARRHRALVAGTAAVFVVLVAGIAGSTWQAVRASRARQTAVQERDRAAAAEQATAKERDRALVAEQAATSERNQAVIEKQRADTEAATATAINNFLQNDLLAQASATSQAKPDIKPDPDLKVRTALDRAAARIGGKFDTQPLVEASIRQTIGNTYYDLGLFPEAQRELERALSLRRRVLGEEHPDTLSSMNLQAYLYEHEGKYSEAEKLFAKVLEARRRVLGEEHRDTLGSMSGLSFVYHRQGKNAQAEALSAKTLDIERRVLGEEKPQTLSTMIVLGSVYVDEGKYPQAEALNVKLLGVQRRVLGQEHPNTLSSMNNLAGVYINQGKYGQAEALLTSLLDVQRRVLGEEHPDTFRTIGNLAALFSDQGRYSQSEALFTNLLNTQRRVLGEEHPETLNNTNNLANMYWFQGKFAQAEVLYSRILEIRRRLLGEEHRQTLNTKEGLASAYDRQGKYAQAEPLFTEVVQAETRVLGPENPDTLTSMNDQAAMYMGQGKYAQAEAQFNKVLEVQRRTLGPENPDTLTSMSGLAEDYFDQDKYPQADELFTKVLEARRRVLGAEHPDTTNVLASLGLLRLRDQRYADAESLLREALKSQEKTGPDTWRRYNSDSMLGASLAGQGKYAEAEPLLVSGYQGMVERETTIPAGNRNFLEDAGEWIIRLYQGWEKPEKAAEWRLKLKETNFPFSATNP
jgi:eukaryotic-like serine/threonine-protein kinase